MKKILIVLCILLALLSLNSFMKLANKATLYQMTPSHQNGFYETIDRRFFQLDVADRDEFIDLILLYAEKNHVIIYNAYKPTNSVIDRHYLYVPDKYLLDIDFYIPYEGPIDFSDSFVISSTKFNSQLFKENFFSDSLVEIKSLDHIKVDQLEFFWNISVAGERHSINSFKENINEFYGKTVLVPLEWNDSGQNYVLFFLEQFFENDGFLILLVFSFLMFVTVVIINHEKREMSILRLLGKSDLYIALKKVFPLFVKSFLALLLVFIIADLLLIKKINHISVVLIFYQLILLFTAILGFILIFIFSVLYIKSIPILSSIRRGKSDFIGYYVYSIAKIMVLFLLIPLSTSQLFWARESIRPYQTILNNYNYYASISSFSTFAGLGTPTDQAKIWDHFYEVYTSELYPNLFRCDLSYSENGRILLTMDKKTAEFHGIDCNEFCSFGDGSNPNTIMPLLSNEFGNYIYDEYDVSIISGNDHTLTYFVLEEKVGEIRTIDTIYQSLPQDVRQLFNVSSQKYLVDLSVQNYQQTLTQSVSSFVSVLAIIIIVNLSVLVVYYYVNKKKLSVQFIVGKKTSSILVGLLVDQFWVDLIAFMLVFKSIMDLNSFAWICLSILIIEVISIFVYSNYMIKKNLKGELR